MTKKDIEIIEFYRQGFNHEYIALVTKTTMEVVRKVISQATKDDDKLYQEHKIGMKSK